MTTKELKRELYKRIPEAKPGFHLFMLGLCSSLGLSLIYLQAYNSWPYSLYCLVQSFNLFMLMVIGHECIHGAGHKNIKVNYWMGQIAQSLVFAPYKMHRRQHLMHHANPGGPRDPEEAAVPKSKNPLIWMFYGMSCLARVLKDGLKHKNERTEIIIIHLALIGFFLVFQWNFIVAWYIPYSLSKFIFWYAAAGGAHAIFKIAEKPIPYKNNLTTQILSLFHEEHHLFPNYPLYQWPRLYWERRKFIRSLPQKDQAQFCKDLKLIPF